MITIETVASLFLAFLVALASGLARAETKTAKPAAVAVAADSTGFSLLKKQFNLTFEDRQLKPAEFNTCLDKIEAFIKEAGKENNVEALELLTKGWFFRADVVENKTDRIKQYQKAIDFGDKAIALSPKSMEANFWSSAAMGKQGLDIGITKSLKNARPLKDRLDVVLAQDEKFEFGGPHRTLSRLYLRVPGWPVSFGDNDKSLEHGKKAFDIAPDYTLNKIYYAEILIKKDGKDQAKKLLEEVVNSKPDAKLPIYHERYVQEAKELLKKI